MLGRRQNKENWNQTWSCLEEGWGRQSYDRPYEESLLPSSHPIQAKPASPQPPSGQCPCPSQAGVCGCLRPTHLLWLVMRLPVGVDRHPGRCRAHFPLTSNRTWNLAKVSKHKANLASPLLLLSAELAYLWRKALTCCQLLSLPRLTVPWFPNFICTVSHTFCYGIKSAEAFRFFLKVPLNRTNVESLTRLGKVVCEDRKNSRFLWRTCGMLELWSTCGAKFRPLNP